MLGTGQERLASSRTDKAHQNTRRELSMAVLYLAEDAQQVAFVVNT